MRRWSVVAVALTGVVALTSCGLLDRAGEDEQSSREAIVVVLVPGDTASGEGVSAAVGAAVSAETDDIAGWTVSVETVEDDGEDDLAEVAAEIVDDDVVAVVGGLSTATIRTVQPIFDARTVPFISPADAAPEHVRGADPAEPLRPYESYFRTTVGVDTPVQALARYASGVLGLDTVAIIDAGEESAEADEFAEAFRDAGGEFVRVDERDASDDGDGDGDDGDGDDADGDTSDEQSSDDGADDDGPGDDGADGEDADDEASDEDASEGAADDGPDQSAAGLGAGATDGSGRAVIENVVDEGSSEDGSGDDDGSGDENGSGDAGAGENGSGDDDGSSDEDDATDGDSGGDTGPAGISEDDVPEMLAAAADAEADAVFVAGSPAVAVRVADELNGEDMAMLGGAVVENENFLAEAGSAADDVLTAVPGEITVDIDVDLPGVDGDPGPFGAAAYDAGTAVGLALSRCLPPADSASAARRGCVGELAEVTFEGFTGDVSFDAFGDRRDTGPVIMTVRRGSLQSVEPPE